MSRSDNIPATSYWARKKVEFEADAEAGATSSLIRYELMTIAEAVDRPISIQQFSALIKVFDDDVPEQRVGHQLRVLWDSGLLKRKVDKDIVLMDKLRTVHTDKLIEISFPTTV